MAHFITEQCTGCTLCAKKCPVEAVVGAPKTRHAIRAALCIDCGVCGSLCPKSAILDGDGRPVPRIKLSQRPKATVDADWCTGCEACASVCREGCISIEPLCAEEPFQQIAVVDRKRCVGCGLCAEVCIKEAVTVAEDARPPATV